MRRVLLMTVLVGVASGCLGEVADLDDDAGSRTDGGTPARDAGFLDGGTASFDSGSEADSGMNAADGGGEFDAGKATDAGERSDAGGLDAAVPLDAGTPVNDAGAPPDDSGTPVNDAGAPPDAGTAGNDAGAPADDAGAPPDDAGTTSCSGSVGDPYLTTFTTDENPLSEACRWVIGQDAGVDWNNPKVEGGHAVASVLSGNPNRYNDSIAHLRTVAASEQYAQGTVYRAAGYDPSPSKHEVELLLRFQITANSARGYEIMWGVTGYLAVVRWNGPLGDYTTLSDSGDPGIGPPVDGDVLKAQIVGNALTVYKNGSKVATVDVTSAGGTVYSTGHVGMGFWPVDNAVVGNYGWKRWQGGSL